MTFLGSVLAALSLLLLAAHFIRAGHPVLVLAAAASLFLLLVRQGWARRSLQVILLLAAAEWVRVMVELVGQRQMFGMPYLRLSVIIGSVALLAVAAALMLSTKRAIAYYSPRPDNRSNDES